VDPPNDEHYCSLDGGDERTDRNDDNTIVIVNPRDSGPPVSPTQQNNDAAIQDWLTAIKQGILHSCLPTNTPAPGLPQLLEVSTATYMLLVAISDGKTKAQCANEA
jgi:hypothetical protein